MIAEIVKCANNHNKQMICGIKSLSHILEVNLIIGFTATQVNSTILLEEGLSHI